MVDIISARKAFNESKYRKETDIILKKIDTQIKEACEQGYFDITTKISRRTEKYIINSVIYYLEEKGYKIVFKENIPDCWNYITVNWNLQ